MPCFGNKYLFVVLFQAFFNILYEESIDCKLVKSTLVDDKVLNWNRINAVICFNYLQQEFYLVSSTMKTLATGKSSKAILKLLRMLINASQSNYGDIELPDECIQDIADIITAEIKPGEDKTELLGEASEMDENAGASAAAGHDGTITFTG